MKKLRLTFLFSVLCALFLALASCGKYELTVPRRLYVDSDELVLHWDECYGANRYVVSINGEEKETNKNEYSLVELEAGDYELKVKARDKDGEYDDSEWSDSIAFTREEESGLRYRLTSDKTAYEVYSLGTAGENAVIDEEYRGKPVIAIADKAFSSDSRLKTIVIGKNVKTVGERAFYMCKNLESVTFKGELTSLGAYAFQSCAKLTSFEIPEGVTSLPTDAFSFCRGLKSVTLPSTLVVVGENTFKNCEALESVTFPQATLSVGKNAFYACEALESVHLGGVKIVEANAFDGAKNLQSVNFSRVQEIGEYAFNGCALLEEAEIPDTAVSIGEGAFFDCTALSTARIGKNVTKVGAFAYYNTAIWNQATDLVYADQWCVGYKSEAQLSEIRVSAPATETTRKYAIWHSDTTGIADQAFMEYRANASGKYDVSGNTTLTAVTFSDRIRRIGANAFRSCAKLLQVTFGTGLETIGNYAFAACPELMSVVMPADGASLTTIGNYAFSNSEKFEKIVNGLPLSLQEIGTKAFGGTALAQKGADSNQVVYVDKWVVDCTLDADLVISDLFIKEGTVGIAKYAFYKDGIANISLPISLRLVNYGAFYQCEALEKVDFSACRNFEKIGTYAFYKCTSLQSVVLPGGLKEIADSTFSGCSSLTDVSVGMMANTLPVVLEKIGNYAFSNCSALSLLNFPDTLRSIGDYAFQGTALSSIKFGSGLETLGNRAFRNNSGLETLSFEACQNLRAISSRAFYNCTSLKEIVFPDNLEEIGDYAFYGCQALKHLQLNEGLLSIGKYAFVGCNALHGIYFPSTVESVGDHAFRSCAAVESIVLPANVLSIGKHAFFSCTDATFYVEEEEASPNFDRFWNSSYRPVVWGCDLSWDKSYVASFTKSEESFSYVSEQKPLSTPYRPGYEFLGWALEAESDEIAYTAEDVVSAPDGTVLYSVWRELSEKGKTYGYSSVKVSATNIFASPKITEEAADAALRALRLEITFGYDGKATIVYGESEGEPTVYSVFYKIEKGAVTFYYTQEDMDDGLKINDVDLFKANFSIDEEFRTLTLSVVRTDLLAALRVSFSVSSFVTE